MARHVRTLPLITAASNDDIDTVRELIAAGEDVNRGNDGGWTPLHVAVEYGSPELVDLMIDAGADVNARNDTHSTPLHVAIWARRRSGISKLLIDRGAMVDAVNRSGKTPLHFAAAQNDPYNAETLLKAGADLHRQDNEGRTPGEIARKNGNAGVNGVIKTFLMLRAVGDERERLRREDIADKVRRMSKARPRLGK